MKKKFQIVECYVNLKDVEKQLDQMESTLPKADLEESKSNLANTLRLCELLLFKFNLMDLSWAIMKKELSSNKTPAPQSKKVVDLIISRQRDVLINIANHSKLNDFEKFYIIHNLPL